VLCTRDRPALLRAALVAVQAAIRPGDEVIVVDSASVGTGTADVAREAGVRVLRCERPGASRARNVGWRAAAHPIVAFTDDDCRPAPGWAAALASALEDTGTGFAFGRITAGATGAPLSLLGEAAEVEILPSRPSPLGGAGNLAARVVALAQIGGFDEVLGAGAALRASEDKDLAWRLLRAGWTGRYVPDAVVVHDAGRGRADAVRTFFRYGVGEGALNVKQAALRAEAPDRLPAPLDVGWSASVTQARRHLRERYEMGVLLDLARAVGALAGRRRAVRVPLIDGRFTEEP
jgi:glycosyltransferase involved in cell wall biosynthesis